MDHTVLIARSFSFSSPSICSPSKSLLHSHLLPYMVTLHPWTSSLLGNSLDEQTRTHILRILWIRLHVMDCSKQANKLNWINWVTVVMMCTEFDRILWMEAKDVYELLEKLLLWVCQRWAEIGKWIDSLLQIFEEMIVWVSTYDGNPSNTNKVTISLTVYMKVLTVLKLGIRIGDYLCFSILDIHYAVTYITYYFVEITIIDSI